MTLFSATLLVLLVMDPFGNVPLFLSVLKPVAPERRRRVIVRELLFALAFLFFGRFLLHAIGITEDTLTVAGGVILFLIGPKMMFPPPGGAFTRDVEEAEDEPFLVPLAIPFVAGPSVQASVLFVMSSDPTRGPEWLAAVLLAWGITGAVLLSSVGLAKRLGRRGLVAIERLMGMVLVAIAVKMILTGIATFFDLSPLP